MSVVARPTGDEWETRDGDKYPLVGRERNVEIDGETVEAEAVAGHLKHGQPAKVTVRTPDGFEWIVDQEDWNV